jgi:hypothetical protein
MQSESKINFPQSSFEAGAAAVHEQRELKVVRLRGVSMREKDKLSVSVRGVLFFGSFFCTSKRNEQKQKKTRSRGFLV